MTDRLSSYVARHPGLTRSAVAARYVDEGLRMDEHPGILFREGPTGRRATVVGGPDVWARVGNRSCFGPATRTGAVSPGFDLLRSLNASVAWRRDLKRGNPAFLPLRTPVTELEKFASACAAFTLAHSNTSWDTSPRHASPREPSELTGLSGARPVFHAVNAWMKLTFDQDNAGVCCAFGTP